MFILAKKNIVGKSLKENDRVTEISEHFFFQILLEYKKCLEIYSSRQRARLRWLKMGFLKTSKLIWANLHLKGLAIILAQYRDTLQLKAEQFNRIPTRLCPVIYYHSD